MLRALAASLILVVSFQPWSTAHAQWGNGGNSWTNPYTGTTWNNPMSSYLVGVSYLVYTGGDEPSERALESVWEAVHRTLAESPDFQRSSHAERQGFYETLVVLATLPLAGYQEGLETGDAETLATYQALAGDLLSTLFDVAPDEVRFTADGLIVGR